MELHNDRIINGLLKADIGLSTPEQICERLGQDVAIYAVPGRANTGDLWPCIWFLAAALERQFTGQVWISAGLDEALPSPIPLGSRCRFIAGKAPECPITVSVGEASPSGGRTAIGGDARGTELSYGRLLPTAIPAHPITCCALGGYLAFAALAQAAGIPAFHEEWRQDSLLLHFSGEVNRIPPLSVLGTGHVGQAFLALAYFVGRGDALSVHLLDKDSFEDENLKTQILLCEDPAKWRGQPKAHYLGEVCRSWGWSVFEECKEITWGWKHGRPDQPLAFLGFDNMDARRIAVEGGFPWVFECGVGTDFCRPKVSWHSIPADRSLAKKLFKDAARRRDEPSGFARSISDSPGDCGRVVFENVEASAPSLGLVAASATFAEIATFLAGNRVARSGRAFVWSPLLPPLLETL